MLSTLSKLRERRAKGDKGFTLIELLVVVVILGILIAIAIPLYLNYRKGANDSAAKSDMRGAISVLEQCNTDNSGYPLTTTALTASGPTPSCTQTINLSDKTKLTYTPNPATTSPVAALGATYTIVATNTGGAGKLWCYNSVKGGSVKDISSTTVNSYDAAVTAGCP